MSSSSVSSSVPVNENQANREEDDDDCAICFEPMSIATQAILQCTHRFHNACIIQALRINNRCPICRDAPASSSTPAPRAPEIVIRSLEDEDLANWRISLAAGTRRMRRQHADFRRLERLKQKRRTLGFKMASLRY